jgi:hypothetical protein
MIVGILVLVRARLLPDGIFVGIVALLSLIILKKQWLSVVVW